MTITGDGDLTAVINTMITMKHSMIIPGGGGGGGGGGIDGDYLILLLLPVDLLTWPCGGWRWRQRGGGGSWRDDDLLLMPPPTLMMMSSLSSLSSNAIFSHYIIIPPCFYSPYTFYHSILLFPLLLVLFHWPLAHTHTHTITCIPLVFHYYCMYYHVFVIGITHLPY